MTYNLVSLSVTTKMLRKPDAVVGKQVARWSADLQLRQERVADALLLFIRCQLMTACGRCKVSCGCFGPKYLHLLLSDASLWQHVCRPCYNRTCAAAM